MQPPGNGALVNQYYWVGICANECTGETLGSMLPDTGGALAGASVSLVLSGLLVSALVGPRFGPELFGTILPKTGYRYYGEREVV